VPFASFDFLAGVEATRAACLGGFDRLAIDHPCCRARFSVPPSQLATTTESQRIEITQFNFGSAS
jgi:hypothetical protein